MTTGAALRQHGTARGHRARRGLYLVGVGLIAFAAASLAAAVLRAPRHGGTLDFAGQVVQLRVSFTPDPPKTGPVPVRITLTDSTGNPLAADEVRVRYGLTAEEGKETLALPGASPGLFRAQVSFADVGSGWIEVIVRGAGSEGRLRLPVVVRPNI